MGVVVLYAPQLLLKTGTEGRQTVEYFRRDRNVTGVVVLCAPQLLLKTGTEGRQTVEYFRRDMECHGCGGVVCSPAAAEDGHGRSSDGLPVRRLPDKGRVVHGRHQHDPQHR